MAELSGKQYGELTDALLDAFPRERALRRMLHRRLQKNLDALTANANLVDRVSELIEQAEAEGWTLDLVRAAWAENRGNARLKAIAAELLPGEPEPAPGPMAEDPRRWPLVAAWLAATLLALAAVSAASFAAAHAGSPRKGSCTFTGTATKVDVAGKGAVKLLDPAPFSDGRAARVTLEGAKIAELTTNVIERPARLVPVNMNDQGASYRVSYAAGPPIVIQLDPGGGSPGRVLAAAGAPACVEAPCDVEWSGAAKTITLVRAKNDPVVLTNGFERDLDPTASTNEDLRIDRIALEGAEGTLSCKDGQASIAGESHAWSAEAHNALALKIALDPKGLAVVVENAAPPVRAGGRRPWIGGAMAAVLDGIVLALSIRWLLGKLRGFATK